MRSALVRFAGLLCLTAVAVYCAPQLDQARPVDVRVTITCPQRFVNVTIQGWVVHRNAGESVRWHLVNAANVASVTISPKDPNSWPFAEAPPYQVTSNAPQTVALADTAQPGTYRYNIQGVCTPSSGPAQTVTIDPDIVVD